MREGLLDEGVLHGEALMIERLINQRLTRVEAADPKSYQPGDVVVFHRDAYGCAAHDTCTVAGVDGGGVELAHPDGKPRRFRPSGNAARNLGVYDIGEIEICAGDRIRWTRNRKAPPARFGREPAPDLVNGEQATVADIGQRSVRFKMDDGRTYSISRIDPQLRHIDHAYSTTVHGAQGMTSPRVIAVLEAGGRADQDLLYVEISRASEGFELVVDDRSPDYPELMQQADTLDERSGAPAKDRETISEWMDAGAGWKEARAEVEKFLELVSRIDGQRKEHEAGCVEAGRLLPAPSLLRQGAKQVYRMAVRLESRMDVGERNAPYPCCGQGSGFARLGGPRNPRLARHTGEEAEEIPFPGPRRNFDVGRGEFRSIHGLSRSGSGQSRSVRIY